MRRVVGAIALIVLLAACSSGGKTHISGALLLTDTSGNYETSVNCNGKGPYSDIAQGAPVTVKNEKGDVIAEGSLEVGSTVSWKLCAFSFSVDAPHAKFYTVEVSHRGGLTQPASEPKFAFTLGS